MNFKKKFTSSLTVCHTVDIIWHIVSVALQPRFNCSSCRINPSNSRIRFSCTLERHFSLLKANRLGIRQMVHFVLFNPSIGVILNAIENPHVMYGVYAFILCGLCYILRNESNFPLLWSRKRVWTNTILNIWHCIIHIKLICCCCLISGNARATLSFLRLLFLLFVIQFRRSQITIQNKITRINPRIKSNKETFDS